MYSGANHTKTRSLFSKKMTEGKTREKKEENSKTTNLFGPSNIIRILEWSSACRIGTSGHHLASRGIVSEARRFCRGSARRWAYSSHGSFVGHPNREMDLSSLIIPMEILDTFTKRMHSVSLRNTHVHKGPSRDNALCEIVEGAMSKAVEVHQVIIIRYQTTLPTECRLCLVLMLEFCHAGLGCEGVVSGITLALRTECEIGTLDTRTNIVPKYLQTNMPKCMAALDDSNNVLRGGTRIIVR
jgi:hypothetical protein